MQSTARVSIETPSVISNVPVGKSCVYLLEILAESQFRRGTGNLSRA